MILPQRHQLHYTPKPPKPYSRGTKQGKRVLTSTLTTYTLQSHTHCKYILSSIYYLTYAKSHPDQNMTR